jgi:hypothetical protein
MSARRYVQTVGVLAVVVTLLVAGFPLWGVQASAAPTLSHRSDFLDARDDNRHDRGDKKEKHHKPDKMNATCTLAVPANPLTAAGLATPYQLANGDATCNEANADTSAFVEATIIDPANGAVSVYRPLVIDQGTEPAAAPVVPTLPDGAVVGIWFGFQGDNLQLVGAGSKGCVNGLGKSLFGQFAYCNAAEFFTAATAAQLANTLTVPPLGVAKDGQACPTVRDFSVVDQDQSDNVSTVYRVTADGKTAQDNAANAGIGTPLVNASDNGLLNRKIQPALGCTPFTAPDLTNGGATSVPALALNELQAGQQAAPVALIPLNDPMALRNGMQNLGKVNLYRTGTGQPIAATKADADGPTYCNNLKTVAPPRIELDAPFTTPFTSPDPAMNLHDFLVQRYQASLPELGCAA